MDKADLKGVIDEIIKQTFERLDYVYRNHRETNSPKTVKDDTGLSRLVFPMYCEQQEFKTRISEQELRFAFVETFNKYCDKKNISLFYSVETPTKGRYSCFAKGDPQESIDGRSAEFDLVIYNNELERVCFIEFKANNADEHDHKKDFVKLDSETEGNEDVLRYFIELIRSYSEGNERSTIDSLQRKLKCSEKKRFVFRCYALEGKSQRGKENIVGQDISDKFKM